MQKQLCDANKNKDFLKFDIQETNSKLILAILNIQYYGN